MSESIPTISLKQDRQVVVSAIRSACLNHGFFQATDSDVPPSLSERPMKLMRTIFALLEPVECSLKSNGLMLGGYEQFQMYSLQENQTKRDLNEGYIGDGAGGKSLCRLIHYKTPEQDGGVEENGKDEHDDIGASLRNDWGLLTVFLEDNVGGLQVLDLKTQTYIPVLPTPGAFVINCDDPPFPLHQPYSIAYFNNGNPGYTVDVLPLGPEWKEWVQGQQSAALQAKRLYEPITVGAYFEMNWKVSVAGQKQNPEREA
ncbi:hypothetical protein ACJ73_06102 [Blastomyces percursus]|uniref:Non-haem dioxygenase N-terminal domain-containing protein n=1 Tax=Blastomyces percursus TaxID=1658174 RepID=A0A1J9Q1W0_9EURO|nr:hypothetical protein ACJ73_06102 [Blastomyces percursus]